MRFALASGCLATIVLTVALARATDKEACAGHAERAQDLRTAGRLVAAREDLLQCAQATCPAVVRTLCERWLTEVTAALPSVIVRARTADGRDVLDVRVLVDGVLRARALDGRALAIDPGPHVVRYERDGTASIDERVMIAESEQNRIVEVRFPEPFAAPPVPAPERSRPAPVGAIVATSVSVLALGGFAVLGLTGQGDYDRCKPSGCSQSDRDSLETRQTVARVLLGTGVVAAIVAGVLFITHATSSPRAASAATGGTIR